MTRPNSKRESAREDEKLVPAQLTTITSLLAGFAFASFTVLITNIKPGFLFQSIFVLTALTIFDLTVVSVIGAILRVAYESVSRTSEMERIEAFWGIASILGITLFFADVALMSFLVNRWLGLVCSGLAGSGIAVVLIYWVKIGNVVERLERKQ